MSNIMEQLENLDAKGWNELFNHMEREEQKIATNRTNEVLYRYLGEVDCPEEMFQEFASVNDVRKCGGKTQKSLFMSTGREKLSPIRKEKHKS